MQSLTANESNSNLKIEKYIQVIYPGLSYSTLQKAFRKKDIKVNGRRVGRDYIVLPGDKLEIYIADEMLAGLAGLENGTEAKHRKSFTIIYEDDNILLVNKEPGISVQPDRVKSQQTLIEHVREYLRKEKGYQNSSNFQPALCHRLDRNTGGLLIFAKKQSSLNFMLEKLENREIRKYYQCLVAGRMEKSEAQLKAYLWKDASKSRVFVSDNKTTGSQIIVTNYKVIEYHPNIDISHLEVELVTGRTHQIRAHLAYIGHPVIGDGKYGANAINRSFGLKHQALWACRLHFAFTESSPMMNYLNGKMFCVDPGFNIYLSQK